jgi:hypothetical protein
MRLFWRCHYCSSKARTAITVDVSSSVLLGGWAMDHFLKPFAPQAFRKIVVIANPLGELVRKRIWE